VQQHFFFNPPSRQSTQQEEGRGCRGIGRTDGPGPEPGWKTGEGKKCIGLGTRTRLEGVGGIGPTDRGCGSRRQTSGTRKPTWTQAETKDKDIIPRWWDEATGGAEALVGVALGMARVGALELFGLSLGGRGCGVAPQRNSSWNFP